MISTLLVEDDLEMSDVLCSSLKNFGFQVTSCENVSQAKMKLAQTQFTIGIFDHHLPDGYGLDLCHWIRQKDRDLAMVMLTAQTDESSAVKALTLGADDYIRKPCGISELVARLQRLVERKNSRSCHFGSLKIDLAKREVSIENKSLHLSKKEFEILRLLVQKRGDATTREEILNALHDEDRIFDRTIDSHLSHLRRKIRETGTQTISITPLYGIGYRLEKRWEAGT